MVVLRVASYSRLRPWAAGELCPSMVLTCPVAEPDVIFFQVRTFCFSLADGNALGWSDGTLSPLRSTRWSKRVQASRTKNGGRLGECHWNVPRAHTSGALHVPLPAPTHGLFAHGRA